LTLRNTRTQKKKKIIASYPAHELEARTKGIPILGSGRIFPVPEGQIACEYRTYSSHWRGEDGTPLMHVIDAGQGARTARSKEIADERTQRPGGRFSQHNFANVTI
jgi:hypothetical protein